MIAQGTEANEPLNLLTGNQCVLGLVAVFIFFAVSGFLITQSFEQTKGPLRYLIKRCLRIFPAFIVLLLLTAFVLGPVVTTLPLSDYLHRPEPYHYVLDNAYFSLKTHELPGVMFVDNPVGLEVNGALWSLGAEFQMYLMVMVLGIFRLLNVPVCILLLALGMGCIQFDALGFLGGWGWTLSFFVIGMLIYKLRDTRIFDWRIALIALAILVASIPLQQFILLFSISGGYLALYIARHPRIPFIPAARFGDLSYGLYIFGWPAEQFVIWLMGSHAAWWQIFLYATLLAGALAFLSWHLIEKRALRLKPRGKSRQADDQDTGQRSWRPKFLSAANSPSSTGGPSV